MIQNISLISIRTLFWTLNCQQMCTNLIIEAVLKQIYFLSGIFFIFCVAGSIKTVQSQYSHSKILHLYNEMCVFLSLCLLICSDPSYCSLKVDVGFVSNGEQEREANVFNIFMYSTHCGQNSFSWTPNHFVVLLCVRNGIRLRHKEISIAARIVLYSLGMKYNVFVPWSTSKRNKWNGISVRIFFLGESIFIRFWYMRMLICKFDFLLYRIDTETFEKRLSINIWKFSLENIFNWTKFNEKVFIVQCTI